MKLTIVDVGTFGGAVLSVNASRSNIAAVGMSTTAVITNGVTAYPYPGASCFDSSVTSPWLQLDVAAVRSITSITVYSAGVYNKPQTATSSTTTTKVANATMSGVNGVSIYVLNTSYSGSGLPGAVACDANVMLPPGV